MVIKGGQVRQIGLHLHAICVLVTRVGFLWKHSKPKFDAQWLWERRN